MEKNIALLGSTGSIGRQVLEVVRRFPEFKIVSLAAHKNKALLEKQIEEFDPQVACLTGGDLLQDFGNTAVFCGRDSLEKAIVDSADIVFVAVTGFSGLSAVLKAIEKKKTVALANKEALVCGGELVMRKARENGVEIIPVDSEHSALWQALGYRKTGFKRLILTASGGPFRLANLREMRDFSAKDALNHPTWKMGEKISIDSATMLNKGFEVIEAHHLFSAAIERIDVVVHPQSIIHSMVEFEDNSVLAQMSNPDMKLPIQAALTYPQKLASPLEPLDFTKIGKLEFFPLDREKFPCFDIAIDSLRRGGNLPCALNAASEEAVRAFLSGRIRFTDIAPIIAQTIDRTKRTEVSYEALLFTDESARATAQRLIENSEKK
ncbi:MAG: 1-deoxy-D-xylulose-5-phosphate reductoisomerase [Clostridia bacterium]|nr:1-deoxy-D-xylulose-5-phosphate reductoisomerase [Clostridia bacterium]